jgi:hypothetical protein
VNITICAAAAAAADNGSSSASSSVKPAAAENEIDLYLKGRHLCAMDACWRAFGYHTYPASCPSVTTIKVKTPDQVEFLLSEKKSCDLLVYMHRPQDLKDLTYTQVFKKFLCGKRHDLSHKYYCLKRHTTRNYFD